MFFPALGLWEHKGILFSIHSISRLNLCPLLPSSCGTSFPFPFHELLRSSAEQARQASPGWPLALRACSVTFFWHSTDCCHAQPDLIYPFAQIVFWKRNLATLMCGTMHWQNLCAALWEVTHLLAKMDNPSKVCSLDRRFLKIQNPTRNMADIRLSSHTAFPLITLHWKPVTENYIPLHVLHQNR